MHFDLESLNFLGIFSKLTNKISEKLQQNPKRILGLSINVIQ